MSEVIRPYQQPNADESVQTLVDNVEGFRLQRRDDSTREVEITARKDENGDYPIVQFEVLNPDGEPTIFALGRDEVAAIMFALSREDQQSKLLGARFREYKEVPVRLVIEATRDIKKGDFVVAWRKERVPLDINYTK